MFLYSWNFLLHSSSVPTFYSVCFLYILHTIHSLHSIYIWYIALLLQEEEYYRQSGTFAVIADMCVVG